MSSTVPLPYRIVRRVARFAAGSFYEVRTYGSAPADDRPMVVVANHPNGGIDPMLVAGAFKPRLHFLAKSSLFDAPGLGTILRAIGALPAFRRQDGADTTRNGATFEATRAVLDTGGVVCIFPEGTSHADSKLRELRTGSARIALDGIAGGAPVSVIPVGLFYPDRERFRSEASVFIGAPLDVPAWLRSQGLDPTGFDATDPQLVRTLTKEITELLRGVTINAEDHQVIDLARRLSLATRPAPGTVTDPVTHGAWAARLDMASQTPDGVAAMAKLRAFFELLNESGLRPEDIPHRDDWLVSAPTLAKDAAQSATALSAAVFGAVSGGPAFHTTHAVSRVVGKQGVGAASIKVAAALVIYPLWAVIIWRIAGRRGPRILSPAMVSPGRAALSRAALIGAVWITHLASRPLFVREGERWRRNLLALRLRRSANLRAKLDAAADDLKTLIDELQTATALASSEPDGSAGAGFPV